MRSAVVYLVDTGADPCAARLGTVEAAREWADQRVPSARDVAIWQRTHLGPDRNDYHLIAARSSGQWFALASEPR